MCTDGLLWFYFIVTFVIINEVEHLFMYLVGASIISFEKCVFRALIHFLLSSS